ncbi:hypothetical protein Tco_0688645 [Tanacetum coccineum]
MWSLDYLSISVPSKGRSKTITPSPSVVKSFIQIPRQGQVTRTKNKKTIVVDKNKILTRKIQPHMRPWVDIIHENAICLGGHKDHVSVCLCHMLYCIETSTRYNLALFILKRMERTQRKPKELLPYGMLLTRLFKNVMFVFPELTIDRYISHDRVMHPFALHYERKTRSDHGKKRSHESNASSSSTTLNHPSSSHPLDDTLDENDDESFHSNSLSPSQNISSSSNVVSIVRQNSPHEKWSRFVTGVKQARNLHDVSYDQLYAYLKQNEADSNENVQVRQRQGYTGSIRRGIGSGITWVARTVGDLNANPPKDFVADGLEGFDSYYEDLQLNDTLILMTKKVDAFDSYYDDELTASAIFLAKLSPVVFINGDEAEPSYDSDILFEVSNYDNYHANDMFNPFVQELSHTEQPNSVNDTYVDVLNDRYVISNTSYTDYNENEVVQDMTSLAQNDVAILSLIENIQHEVTHCNTVNLENKQENETLTIEHERYKEKTCDHEPLSLDLLHLEILNLLSSLDHAFLCSCVFGPTCSYFSLS